MVHCVAGINRSGLVACAAHMVMEKVNVVPAVIAVRDQRGPLLWNHAFQEQLVQLAATEGLLGSKPDGFTDDEPLSLGPPLPPPAHVALDRIGGR